jgi:hypothetical protein
MARLGGVGGFFTSQSVQVRKCRPTSKFSHRAELWCQSSINRFFTSTVPKPTDDLIFTLRFLDSLSRTGSCRGALRVIVGVNARTDLGAKLRIPCLWKKSPVEKFQRTPDRRRSRLRLSFYRRSWSSSQAGPRSRGIDPERHPKKSRIWIAPASLVGIWFGNSKGSAQWVSHGVPSWLLLII